MEQLGPERVVFAVRLLRVECPVIAMDIGGAVGRLMLKDSHDGRGVEEAQ